MTFRFAATVLLLACAVRALHGSPEIPGKEQTQPIALVGATIHPLIGETIEDGMILFDKGRIVSVGRNLAIPPNGRRIKLHGKHVYPPLFDAHTNLGLIEINAVRATRDLSETGALNPNVRAEVAVNPDSELIPVTRSGGVLLCLTAPSGSLVAGTSAVLQLDGWTWEEMSLARPVAMHIYWPKMTPSNNWWVEDSHADQVKKRDKELAALGQLFADTRAYLKARLAQSNTDLTPGQVYDARLEAMVPVLRQKTPLMVHANEIQQIQAAVALSVRENVQMILHGGYDAPHCAALLREHNVPVIVGGIYRLPRRRSDPYDAPFTLPERLRQAGIRFCLSGAGRFGASNVRNLPYHAATAAAYGLPRDEALKSITLYPAQILGIDERVGSLEPGKDATLIVTDGDPLETTTLVEMAFIQGRRVELNDRHRRLWKKYQEKYRRLSE